MTPSRRLDRHTFLEATSLATAGLLLGGKATARAAVASPASGPRQVRAGYGLLG